jgi:hypothetical protein
MSGLFTLILFAGCMERRAAPTAARPEAGRPASQTAFTPSDERLLDEVQFACFQYFWKEVGQPACLAKDRLKAPVASIAAVGFQLASLPIGVERGWITRQQGAERARTVLAALVGRADNKRFGVYLHYPDQDTAGPTTHGYEVLASTVDHALLVSGAIVAAEYFGGPVRELTEQMIRDTNWKAFAVNKDGYLSMGWKPDNSKQIDGSGQFLELHWWTAADEERLVYLLAVGAPKPEFAVAPEMYYRLKRPLGHWAQMPEYVISWPGTMFTYFFSHCFIDYKALGTDDPRKFGIEAPRVNWFENSRRAALTQRARCIEMAGRYPTLGPDRWGLSACAARDGYIVPEIRPNIRDHDEWFEGTIAPYAAASAIMFTPEESLAAIRAFRALHDESGRPLVWRDPRAGGYGFVDSFNLSQHFVSDDYVGIDQGPMLMAIENARSGLIWRLFMQNTTVRTALRRLHLDAAARR